MKNIGKNLAKKAGKKLGKILLPYIIMFSVFMFVITALALMVAAVYGSMTEQGAMTSVEASEQDEEIRKDYQRLVNKYNVMDTWLVSGESSPNNPHYPGTGQHLGEMKDRYRNDYELRLKWSTVHAISLYWAFTEGKSEKELTHEKRKQLTEDLHPHFYYKKSTVTHTYTDSEGNTESSSYEVYLLVEAYTITGHYQYHYEWVTDGDGYSSTTYEQLKDRRQIFKPDKWKRFDDYIRVAYDLTEEDDMELNRTYILQAADGFDKQKEWMEWLVKNVGYAGFISSSMIPSELMPFFREAEEKYNIPWWFLAAVAFKESSFNPLAENPSSKCYGLMQLQRYNWENHSVTLGFDPVIDRDNPRAQVLTGAYMLYSAGLQNIDWDGNWQEDTLDVLIYYGGYSGKNAKERCRREYASKIWDIANQFANSTAMWPVPGYTYISSYYDLERIHPVHKVKRPHYGIDIPAPIGTPVVSVSGGTVYFARHNQGEAGNMIKIRDAVHQYTYMHLYTIDVHEGDVVVPGQVIGTVGNTGVGTGPHLHIEITELATAHRIDPLMILVR